MNRRSIGLLLWGVAISALGLWYIFSWVQSSGAERDAFSFAVGIFCLLVGAGVIAMNLVSGGKGKGD